MLLQRVALLVDSWCQAAAAAAIPYCATAAAWKLRKYVGCNRGYNHFIQSLVVPQVNDTREKPTPITIWLARWTFVDLCVMGRTMNKLDRRAYKKEYVAAALIRLVVTKR